MAKTLAEIRALHPEIKQSFDKLMVRLIENHLIGSTLVEGSTLTELEAQQVLQGESVHGHTIEEHLELTNGKDAASYIHRLFFQNEEIQVSHLDQAHALLMTSIGDPKKKTPGNNRGVTKQSAYTVILDRGKPIQFQYENPLKVRDDFQPYLDFHINQPLAEKRKAAVKQLTALYFQFQMLHPYSDGNGRLGRFLVSAKAAAEKGWFFRFEARDGPEHLRIMMSLSLQYIEKNKDINYQSLERFLEEHLQEL